MMLVFDHTSHVEKQTARPVISSHATLCLEQIVGLLDPKMAQFLMNMLYKAFTLLWTRYYLYSPIYPHM